MQPALSQVKWLRHAMPLVKCLADSLAVDGRLWQQHTRAWLDSSLVDCIRLPIVGSPLMHSDNYGGHEG